jgi:DNA-binding response OmpR family regulator
MKNNHPSKKRVLIVDDDSDLLALVGFHVVRSGFEVIFAENGDQALEIAARERPDMVLLDIMLPGINGMEVCAKLRKNNRTSDIPVIMLSALARSEQKINALDTGADDYITKPFSPRELMARVKRVLERAARGNI